MLFSDVPTGLLLKQAQHVMRLALDEAFASLGVTMPQWAVLRAARDKPGASGAEVARASFSSPQTINLTMVRLEQAGFIERRPSAAHGRVIETHLTAKGQAILDACDRAYAATESRFLSGFASAEIETYRAFLARSIAAFDPALVPAPSP